MKPNRKAQKRRTKKRKSMKSNTYRAVRSLLMALLSTVYHPLSTFAQGTAFTYQGRLNDGGNPANGNYDLRLAIYDAASSVSLVGRPLTNAPTTASNGVFNVTLDPGAGVFTGPARGWKSEYGPTVASPLTQRFRRDNP
jgi:hypothetical protein